MGLFDLLFGKQEQPKANTKYFELLNGYTPRFMTWNGALYESELVRSAIDARSRHISKLSIEFYGSAKAKAKTQLKKAPNSQQTWSQFLYRLNTILDMQNTAFIVPVYDYLLENINGIATILPQRYELVEHKGEAYIRFYFSNNRVATSKLNETGIMTKYQYDSDYFGSDNRALRQTMELLNIQNQGIEQAIKNGASYRFMAHLSNFASDEDLINERKRFTENNLQGDGGGILLFPNTYSDIKQISAQPYSIDANQMKLIHDNVFRYFGVNDAVMMNSAKGDELDAFFNGAIEPFAIQLSDVLTKMLYTSKEQANGCRVVVSANRLQYMTTSEKVSMAQQLADRGAIMIDEIRELFNMPPLPDGQGNHAPIRGEYYFLDEKKEEEANASEE